MRDGGGELLLEDGHYEFQDKPSSFIRRQYRSRHLLQDVDLSVGDWIVHFGTAERCIIGLDYQ